MSIKKTNIIISIPYRHAGRARCPSNDAANDAAHGARMAQGMARIGPQGGIRGPELVAHAPSPKVRAARTGRADTQDVQTKVLHALRVRADGSPIERISGIGTLLKGGGWGVAYRPCFGDCPPGLRGGPPAPASVCEYR